jgi:hypothetical protein
MHRYVLSVNLGSQAKAATPASTSALTRNQPWVGLPRWAEADPGPSASASAIQNEIRGIMSPPRSAFI